MLLAFNCRCCTQTFASPRCQQYNARHYSLVDDDTAAMSAQCLLYRVCISRKLIWFRDVKELDRMKRARERPQGRVISSYADVRNNGSIQANFKAVCTLQFRLLRVNNVPPGSIMFLYSVGYSQRLQTLPELPFLVCYYLRQADYVFTCLCVSVCLSVNRNTQKLVTTFS